MARTARSSVATLTYCRRHRPGPAAAGLGLLGAISAVLVMAGFFLTLHQAGWHWGDPTGSGTALHHAYQQATTITFAGIVACQIGTAFAARTDHASLFPIGLFSNRLLLWGIAFELVFTTAVIYTPLLQHVFGTASLSPSQLAVIAPFPLIVWAVDEIVRWARRRGAGHSIRPAAGSPV